jgi:hypothetical protein
MYTTGNKPPGAALLERHDEKFEANSFFFSPEAVTLIPTLLETCGATVCQPPRLTERIVLIIGDDEVLTNLRYLQATVHRQR